MLDLLHSDHFTAVADRLLHLRLPDGRQLALAIDSVTQAPRSAMPESRRVPFCVTLHSLEPTDFVDGLCTLDLPDHGEVSDLYVSRNPPLGRDASLGYFSIVFN